jgi:hypothetical protein
MATISCCHWQLLLHRERMVTVSIGFLERLKQMVVEDVPDVCVIHDRYKGILQAISDIKEGSQEHYRAAQWPDVHSRWCMRHMGANFHSQFKNKELTKLFKRLCSTNQEKNSSTCGKN